MLIKNKVIKIFFKPLQNLAVHKSLCAKISLLTKVFFYACLTPSHYLLFGYLTLLFQITFEANIV